MVARQSFASKVGLALRNEVSLCSILGAGINLTFIIFWQPQVAPGAIHIQPPWGLRGL